MNIARRKFAFWLYVAAALWLTIFLAKLAYFLPAVEWLLTYDASRILLNWPVVLGRLAISLIAGLTIFYCLGNSLIRAPLIDGRVGVIRFSLVLLLALPTGYLDATKLHWAVPFPPLILPSCTFGDLSQVEYQAIADEMAETTRLSKWYWVGIEQRYGDLEEGLMQEIEAAFPKEEEPARMLARMHALAGIMNAEFKSGGRGSYAFDYYIDLSRNIVAKSIINRWMRVSFYFAESNDLLKLRSVSVLFPNPIKGPRRPFPTKFCPLIDGKLPV